MKRLLSLLFIAFGFTFAIIRIVSFAQNSDDRRPENAGGPTFDRPARRPQGAPGQGGRRPGDGPGMGVRAPVRLVKQFDKNGDKWLNLEERKAAREFLEKEKAEGRGPRRPGFRGRSAQEPPEPGPRLSPAEVKVFPSADLYDPTVLRTLFIQFESPDWEQELTDFYRTDVDIPVTLIVDGKTYSEAGIHFRGASSFFTVGPGRKHSINIAMDYIHKDQNLHGYRTLNLLNSHTDPTFLRSVLYLQAARDYIPAPKANYVRLVINGESWGVYVNAQQFNKDLIKEWFGTTEGARWKVPGSPQAKGGLEYLGENPAPYKAIYEIKTKDNAESWTALIHLCKALNQTPAEKLEAVLTPILDIDGALKFLALENALINSDGYWIRTSDFNLYRDLKGRFHLIPHDANETFRPPAGPGWRGDGAGVELDPLQGSDDPSRPLLHKLLAVPSLRAKYLGFIRDIAEKWLDWNTLGPLAEKYQAVIATDVKNDTRKLYSFEAFTRAVVEETEEQGFRGPQRSMSLKQFAEQRREFLLNHPAIEQAARP